jgi:hypothetical protein
MAAAESGCIDILEFLLSNGQARAKCKNGTSPLMMAAH